MQATRKAKNAVNGVAFRPLQNADLPVLTAWLAEPHVRRFYQKQPVTLPDVAREYGPTIRGEEPSRSHLAIRNGAPFAYLQCYRNVDYPEWCAIIGVRDGISVDLFIGDPVCLRRGLGQAAADASAVPVVLYNVPSRTGVDMLPGTVARLAKHPRIVALKEATPQLTRARELLAQVPQGFALLSGDDETACEAVLSGARGVISVTANLLPAEVAAVMAAALRGEGDLARLMKALRLDTQCRLGPPVEKPWTAALDDKWVFDRPYLAELAHQLDLSKVDVYPAQPDLTNVYEGAFRSLLSDSGNEGLAVPEAVWDCVREFDRGINSGLKKELCPTGVIVFTR